MQYTQNDMSGVLFRVSDSRRTSERSPNMNGNCMIAGQEYYISGWVKKSKKNDRDFLSLAFSSPKDRSDRAKAAAESGAKPQSAESDIPF